MKTTMMKVALVVALIATGGALTLATGGSTTTNSDGFTTTDGSLNNGGHESESILNWIKNFIHCPDFIGQQKQQVQLWLQVDADGNLKVLNIKSEDEKLTEYVLQQLNGKTLDLPINEVNRSYHFVLRFQTI